MRYEMERDLLDELCAQHHESGWREGYEQCRREMTDECDRMVREAERHGGDEDLAAVPATHGRHFRAERREVASITAELREYLLCHPPAHYADFSAIADRIDAEHQKAIRELNNLADASVLLPVDADGEIIRVGDMMERGKSRGHVIALMLSEYPKKWGGGLHWGVQLEGEQAPTALDLTFHHYHAPTVEDVLREFWSDVDLAVADSGDPSSIIAEYAAKLRLADDGEGQ